MSFEAPPQFFEPPAASTGDSSAPNMKNMGGNIDAKEAKVAKQARRIRKSTSTIIFTRKTLADYLAKFGMKLLTSAVDFQNTGDFILSSIVVHTNGVREPLGSFIVRYPQFQPSCIQIKNQLVVVRNSFQVKGLNPSLEDME